MPPKDKRGAVKPRDAAKMPRNPAEDALYSLTLAGDLFEEQVLARLEPTDRGMLRLVNRDLKLAVMYSYGKSWTFKVSDFVGSVERFEWALKNKIFGQAPPPREWSECTFILVKAIIEGGNLDVLKRAELAIREYAHLQFLTSFPTAAQLGQTHIFEWFMDQPAVHNGMYAWGRALRYAAENGHLDILKVFKARADTYPDDDIWNILKWDDVREAAFLEGNVEICEWVCAHGTCEQDMRTFLQRYSDRFNPESVVVMGRLEMLQWFMARLEMDNLPHIVNSKKNNYKYVQTAAQYGHLEMLKWLVENGFKFTGDALTAAAKEGHLECVVYLRERGCNITPTVSKVTVNHARMHVLRWAIENGCKFDPQWTLDQLEQIDSPETGVGRLHACHIKNGTVHENFGADLQWVIQRAHQQITDDKLAAEEKQRRKDEKQRREAKKRKAN
jgi:hypothetical protein